MEWMGMWNGNLQNLYIFYRIILTVESIPSNINFLCRICFSYYNFSILLTFKKYLDFIIQFFMF